MPDDCVNCVRLTLIHINFYSPFVTIHLYYVVAWAAFNTKILRKNELTRAVQITFVEFITNIFLNNINLDKK